jgi:hypothetical protein
VRVRLRHAQSGGLTALIWLPESVAAPESGGQPLGRLRKFDAEDYGPAPSLSAPTAGGTFGQATLPPPPAPAAPAPAPAGNGAGNGGFSGAAATAARIPRLGGAPGGNGNGNGNGNGGFAAFGGAGTGTRPTPAMPGPGPGPTSGPNPTIDAPGGPLPVRTPGNHPLGPAAPASSAPMFGGGGGGGGDSIGDSDFATTRMPALGGDGGAAGASPVSVGSPAGNSNGASGSDGSQVTVPPTVSAATDQRLPIFDSLESDWFRRSGKSLSSAAAAPAAGQTWNSPADEGYRAARIAASPEAGETTTAGLPKRVPRANLVPGSVGSSAEETEAAPPARSAETIRNRMSSFQRGVREARTAAPQNEES